MRCDASAVFTIATRGDKRRRRASGCWPAPTVPREFRRDRSLRRVLTLPWNLAPPTDMSELFPVRFLFHPLARHCFGALAAPGACEASALPSAPFRFWLPRAGPPRKAASGLGSRAHSLPGARDRRAEQGETYVPQQNHSHRFPRRRCRKEGQQRNEHRGVLTRQENVVEERRAYVGISDRMASMRCLRQTG